MRLGAPVFLAAALVLSAAPAYAYIDPGTGGLLTQLVTGGVAGLLLLLRLYWSRITGLFRRPSRAAAPSEAPAGPRGA